MMNHKIKIYRFDENRLATNPDEFVHDFEIKSNGKVYSFFVKIQLAQSEINEWIGGGSLQSCGVPVYHLNGCTVSCHSDNKKHKSPKRAASTVLTAFLKHANDNDFPRKIIVAIGNLFDQYSQLDLFKGEEL